MFLAAKSSRAPRMEENLPQDYEVVQGHNVTLECIGYGSPVPYIVWDKHGGDLPAGRTKQIWAKKIFECIMLSLKPVLQKHALFHDCFAVKVFINNELVYNTILYFVFAGNLRIWTQRL